MVEILMTEEERIRRKKFAFIYPKRINCDNIRE